jgi:hypothetical protein
MLASAPFDDWWHNAYGLDVQIVSPPHTVLALGIYGICQGALILSLARQNRTTDEAARRRYTILYLAAGGLMVMNFAIFLTEFSARFLQHGAVFYHMSAAVYPFALVAVARGAKHRWPATIAASVFMVIMLALMWIIQLFPATPMLGPIYQPITHFVGLAWPVWLVVPAVCIDRIRQRIGGRFPAIIEAVILGVAFAVSFFVVQWLWSWFMVRSPWARNAFFNADNFVYWAQPSYVARSHRFVSDGSRFGSAALQTVLIASLSAWVGLGWGKWMSKVRR